MKQAMVAAFAILLCLSATAGEPEIIGWSTHGQDMPYLRRVIARAPEFGVNMLQLCQFFAKHGGNEPENEAEAANLREVCRLGRENKIDVYLWVWEISRFPKEKLVSAKVNLDDPVTWEWVAARYRRIFDAAPDLAGLILTLRECDYPVQDPGKCSSTMDESHRVAKLVEAVYGVCRERKKTLYVRDFSVSPDEMKNIVEAMNLMPAEVRAMSKSVARDWHAYLPDNPALDMYQGHSQIVEFDLGSEYNGQGAVPYTVAEEVHRRWANARSKGASGAVARIDRFDARIFDTLDDANTYAYEAIMRRGVDPRTAVRGYCVKRFGEPAADALTTCLLRTYEISNRIFNTLRFKFLQDHSTIPTLRGADGHIVSSSLAPWIPEEKKTEEECLKPTLQTVERAEAEKNEAIRLAKLNLEELEGVRSKLKPEDYDWVKGYFKRSLDFAELWKPLAASYLAGRVCLTDRSEATLAQARRRLAEFGRAIDAFEAMYGKEFSIGEMSRKSNHVVPDCRELLAEIAARVEGTAGPPKSRSKAKN